MTAMGFTWLNKQGVQSDQGFEVQIVSRDCIEYREFGRVITVDVEMGMSGSIPCLLISPGCFSRWDDMPQSATLDEDEQLRIERNFREAMRFQDVKIVAEHPEY
jgi:hypothetical protein